MNQDKPGIVICGSIAIDRIMNFSGSYRELIRPEKLHALSLSTLLDKLEDSEGGIGANIAYALAQLGEHPVLIGSVGQDAEEYIQRLSEAGVDTSHIHLSALKTASFNVITDSEDSQIGGFFQGAMSDSDSVSFTPWAGQNVLAFIAAHNPDAMNRQVQECEAAGIKLIYDPGQQVADEATDLAGGVAACEILLLNDYELAMLTQRLNMRAEEVKTSVPVMITTLGKEGSLIEGKDVGEPIRIGIAKPDQVVDPTGAGDAYRAGFLYGYLRQWDLKRCAQLGATVASFIIEKHGTQTSLDPQAIMNRYKENFNEEIQL